MKKEEEEAAAADEEKKRIQLLLSISLLCAYVCLSNRPSAIPTDWLFVWIYLWCWCENSQIGKIKI